MTDARPLEKVERLLGEIIRLAGGEGDCRDAIIDLADAALATVEGCSHPTPPQRRVLNYLKLCHGKGVMPTYAEIACSCGFASKSSVHALIKNMEQRGLIRGSTATRPRSIRVLT